MALLLIITFIILFKLYDRLGLDGRKPDFEFLTKLDSNQAVQL